MSAFNAGIYEQLRAGAQRSAALALPVILDLMKHSKHGKGWPEGVLDVGAGEGCWADAARVLRPDAVVLALDDNPSATVAEWHAGEPLPPLEVLPDGSVRKWPLALCLELAEHLDAEHGDWLVGEVCRVAERIAWSAAIPGQGGVAHINEQWPEYWAERFLRHGYALRDPWRDTLWDLDGIEPWYAQNLLLARPFRVTERYSSPRALVHPTIWAWRLADIAAL